MLFDHVMSVLHRSLANLQGCPVCAVGKDVADPFPVGEPVQQPDKSPLLVFRGAFKVLVGQNAGLIQLNSESQYLRG